MIQVSHLPLGAPKITEVKETQKLLQAAEQESVSRLDPAGSRTTFTWQEQKSRLWPCPFLMDSISLPYISL